jgi:hypothetical protein
VLYRQDEKLQRRRFVGVLALGQEGTDGQLAALDIAAPSILQRYLDGHLLIAGSADADRGGQGVALARVVGMGVIGLDVRRCRASDQGVLAAGVGDQMAGISDDHQLTGSLGDGREPAVELVVEDVEVVQARAVRPAVLPNSTRTATSMTKPLGGVVREVEVGRGMPGNPYWPEVTATTKRIQSAAMPNFQPVATVRLLKSP